MTDDLARRLVDVLEPQLGDGVVVENLQILTGGASRATWSFDAITRQTRRALILRTGGDADDVHAGMEAEARAQRLAAAAGAPVPHVLVADDSPDALGTAYLICDLINGETIARRIARTLDTKPPQARADLLQQCAAALAAIHRSDITGMATSADQLQAWRGQLDEIGDTTATFEWAFRWLSAHQPASSEPVLVHGDFRMGNLIVEDAQLAAVLDWELVHVGERYDDLAWFCTKAWRFGAPASLGAAGLGSIDEFVAAYERESDFTVDREQLRWWLVRATLCWGIICRYQAERHLSGQTPSVELAAIGRRVCETEWDLLDLLEDPGGQERWGHLPAEGQGADSGNRPECHVTELHGRPTAAELIAAVADFLDGDVRTATSGQVNFHARVAANVLRTVRRELLDTSGGDVAAALAHLGYADESHLAREIRAGGLDGRDDDVIACLRTVVRHRLRVAHPGYEEST